MGEAYVYMEISEYPSGYTTPLGISCFENRVETDQDPLCSIQFVVMEPFVPHALVILKFCFLSGPYMFP